MTKEEYIDISDYGYDEIKGIWSNYWETFLNGHVNKNGYVQVTLKCTDGKQRLFMYHRAIWYLAYGPIPEGLVINHINECKTDNRLENLEVCTVQYNNTYNGRHLKVAAKHRGVPKPKVAEALRGKHHSEETKAKIGKTLSKQVVALDNEGNVILEFASTREAGRNGFSQGAVAKCCNNCYGKLSNVYKGLRWYWKKDWEKLVWEKKLEVKKA